MIQQCNIRSFQGQVEGEVVGESLGLGLDNKIHVLHGELQSTISNMQIKIESVLHKQEQQFVSAYTNHLYEIQRQMCQLQKKLSQQQRQLSENDKMNSLERQIISLGEETGKLYSIIQQKQLQLSNMKQKLKQANDDIKRLEKENKGMKLQLREAKVDLEEYSLVFEEFKKDRENDRKKVDALVQRQSKYKLHQQFMETIKAKPNNIQKQVNKIHTVRQVSVSRTQLQDLFVDCIKTVKRQVKNRNVGRGISRVNNVSLEQFKNIDKLKVLLMLVENQKIIDWLYHKIFPDRHSQLAVKLNGSKGTLPTHRSLNKSLGSARVMSSNQNEEQLGLPEIKKYGSSHKNNVMMKDGKITIHDYLYN